MTYFKIVRSPRLARSSISYMVGVPALDMPSEGAKRRKNGTKTKNRNYSCMSDLINTRCSVMMTFQVFSGEPQFSAVAFILSKQFSIELKEK